MASIHCLLTLLPFQMDMHGLEAIPTPQMVCILRLPLGLHRNDPSNGLQLGWLDGLQILPRSSRRYRLNV
jgi:hypothetical protein